MKVIGYVRVSTDEQSRDGVSLAVQTAKVAAYADLHGLELAGIETDAGVSAKTLDRPGLSRALGLLDAGEATGLVIYKLDRLTRSLGDWSHLIDRYFGEKAGRGLMSVCDSIDTRSASGRMVLNLMMTVAQWERETIVERTRSAIDYKRSRSERIGTIPYGAVLADDRKRLDPDEAERQVVADILRWRAEGWPLRKIAAELDALGITTKSGRPWSHSTIQRLVRRSA